MSGPSSYYGTPWYQPPAPAPSRAGRTVVLAGFLGALAGIVILAAIVVVGLKPPPPEPPCDPGLPCVPGPPIGLATPAATASPYVPIDAPPEPGAPPFIAGTLWTSPLGFSFEYDPLTWRVTESSDSRVVLEMLDLDASAVFVATARATSPQALLAQLLADVDAVAIGRVVDDDSYDALLGPSIGYVRGVGDVYAATLLSAGGVPAQPLGITALASTSGELTVGLVVIAGSPDQRVGSDTLQHRVRALADDLLKTVSWTAGQ